MAADPPADGQLGLRKVKRRLDSPGNRPGGIVPRGIGNFNDDALERFGAEWHQYRLPRPDIQAWRQLIAESAGGPNAEG
jgi:hypothetical protein